MTVGALSCIFHYMRPTPEQITKAREIAPYVRIEGGAYILTRGARKVVTDHLRATDELLELWDLAPWSDATVAEMALDEALDRTLGL